MCYDISAQLKASLKRAKHNGDENAVEQLKEDISKYELQDYYVVSGYAHPPLLNFTQNSAYFPKASEWGLIPSFAKDSDDASIKRKGNLNARIETILTKPSFEKSVHEQRGIILCNGYFEHQHQSGVKIPHYITRKDGEPFTFATIINDWINPQTGELISSFAIVTTPANELMTTIHNNPKRNEARMLCMLDKQQTEQWLDPSLQIEQQLSLFKTPKPSEYLETKKVRPISGKRSVGNSPKAWEIDPSASDQLSIF